jgi:hypothetical protein
MCRQDQRVELAYRRHRRMVEDAPMAASVSNLQMSAQGSGTAFQASWPPCLLLRMKPPKTAGKRTSTTLTAGFSPVADVVRSWLGRLGIATTGLREIVLTGSRQLVQQGLGVLQVGRVEALGEPAVDRCEEVVRLGVPTLIAPQPSKASGRAQLPKTRGLPAGDS